MSNSESMPPIEPGNSSPQASKRIHPLRVALLVLSSLLVAALYAGTFFVLTFEREISTLQTLLLLLPFVFIILTFFLKRRFKWSAVVAAHVCIGAIALLLVGLCASSA